MSRIRNSDEFLHMFRKIRGDYDRLFRPKLGEIRKRFTNSGLGRIPQNVDESLEAHSRAYVINSLLAALNWRLNLKPDDGLPNLIPEAAVVSERSGHIRFLDYLGFEEGTLRPLLIVETKRPRAPLPRSSRVGESSSLTGLPSSESSTVSGILSLGLSEEELLPLVEPWNKWLSDIRDYVVSVFRRCEVSPRRVVSTNGDWLILFLNPSDAFLPGGSRDAGSIIVFESREDIESRHAEIFRHLEFSTVAQELPGLIPSELSFHVSGDSVDRIVHGLHLRYVEEPRVYLDAAPVIKVAPILYLRTRHGAWLRVEAPPHEYSLPHNYLELEEHLDKIGVAAQKLLSEVQSRLKISLNPTALSIHFEDEEAFEVVPGVIERSADRFIIITGDKTHYVLSEPSVPDCPYHDWRRSRDDGCSSLGSPILSRLIEPRSFFFSGEDHHCTHRDVVAAKASQIRADNRERCGLRSGGEGAAFCEIWRFETHLCCRTCVFEEVCTKAEIFQLPCSRSNQP